MSAFLDNQVVRDWVECAMKQHTSKNFGTLKSGVIWTNKKNKNGSLVVPLNPIDMVNEINSTPWIILNGHDPGCPVGQIIQSAYFELKDGVEIIAAVLGFYKGAEILGFTDLNLNINEIIRTPTELPILPNNTQIQFAFDPRDVDSKWLENINSYISPVEIKNINLSHNSSETVYELIRVGLPFLALVWNPFVTTIASEAGKDTYTAIRNWVLHLLSEKEKLRNPILSIQSFQDDCNVSFLIRGKNIKLSYEAYEALSNAAVQAARLIGELKKRGTPANELTYEFDKDALRWYPSYAILNDGKIITDSSKLIAVEQLPKELSFGFSVD